MTEFDPTFGGGEFLTSGSVQPDGRPIFGGNFTTVNGAAVSRLVRFNTDGTTDTSLTVGADSAGHISSIVVHPDGSLTIGGNFSQFGGAARANLARVTPAGALDTSFNQSTNGEVRTMAMLPDGKLLIGGNFSQVGGTSRRLARLNTDGSIDTAFTGTFAGGNLRGIAVQPDGKIIIVGGFTTVNGEARSRIARLNADGTTDTTFAAVETAGSAGVIELFGVAIQTDGKILVLGNFETIAGQSRAVYARLNADGTLDTDFGLPALAGSGGTVNSLALQADGKILVGGSFSGPGASAIRVNADGTLDATFSAVDTNNPPVLVIDGTGHLYLAAQNLNQVEGEARDEVGRVENPTAPTSQLALAGTTVSLQLGGSAPVPSVVFFEASVDGSTWTELGSGTYDSGSQSWRLTGADVPEGATELRAYAAYSINGIDSGLFMVTADIDGGTTPPPSGSRLLNISTRGQVSGGDDVLIPGFVISGTGTKRLLIRGVGPTITEAPFNLTDSLDDPQIALQRWNGSGWDDVASNDNWGNDPDIAETGADLFAFSLKHEEEAALLVDLGPGQYTVVTRGASDSDTGVSTVEVYDADGDTATAQLINVSTRGFGGVGEQVLIPGFVVSAGGSKTVLIRAVGPGLTARFGLQGVMADPKLTLYNSSGAPIATQDNWGDDPNADLTAEVAAEVFAFGLEDGSADAALVTTLQPGSYTMVGESAVAGETGILLVEVYVVPDEEN